MWCASSPGSSRRRDDRRKPPRPLPAPGGDPILTLMRFARAIVLQGFALLACALLLLAGAAASSGVAQAHGSSKSHAHAQAQIAAPAAPQAAVHVAPQIISQNDLQEIAREAAPASLIAEKREAAPASAAPPARIATQDNDPPAPCEGHCCGLTGPSCCAFPGAPAPAACAAPSQAALDSALRDDQSPDGLAPASLLRPPRSLT